MELGCIHYVANKDSVVRPLIHHYFSRYLMSMLASISDCGKSLSVLRSLTGSSPAISACGFWNIPVDLHAIRRQRLPKASIVTGCS